MHMNEGTDVKKKLKPLVDYIILILYSRWRN